MNTKQEVLTYLKNCLGWRTKRKLVIFAVDDYGNVRLHSAKARANLDKAGLKRYLRFDSFDALETSSDFESLFEVLNSFKDCKNNPAIFSALSVCGNINFERVIESDYSEYFCEPLNLTYTKLGRNFENNMKLWKEGMSNKLIHPEFHGREHLNIRYFNEKIQIKDKEILECINNRSYTSLSPTLHNTIRWNAAFDFYDFKENEKLENVIVEGLEMFSKVFGIAATTFNGPGGEEHHVLHKILSENGIRYIENPLIKKEHQGNNKYKYIINYLGKPTKNDQNILVRNCLFEPTEPIMSDWVNYTLKQMEIAFKLNKPAIISSHRVNFCGHIDENNRKIGLDCLSQLLKKITKRWPEIEFITISELGNLISAKTII